MQHNIMVDENHNSETLDSVIQSCGPAVSKICLATPLVQMAIAVANGNKPMVFRRTYKFPSDIVNIAKEGVLS